jgi:hypothetical protein
VRVSLGVVVYWGGFTCAISVPLCAVKRVSNLRSQLGGVVEPAHDSASAPRASHLYRAGATGHTKLSPT